jgi:tellurium resistance protein TerD
MTQNASSNVINLTKGQKVDLTKTNPGLSAVNAGLGWDVNQSGGAAFDLDASVLLLDEHEKFTGTQNLIYFGNQKTPDGSVIHSGDNLTGQGSGDDEVIKLDLNKIPANIHTVLVVVNIYEAQTRRQNFGMVQNAFIRVVDATTNAEIMRYDLSEDYSSETGMEMGKFYRHNGEWKFQAIGTGWAGTLQDVVNKYTA